ncbi:putative bifunctional diguanylate cyclase/phosphodiesterase [Calidifontibacillus erzurumensis]|uniref:EAL domain-containing protein n=1 Tax=Calidifontibacillus erzurumensis TaxID=2741433 RepID=A0A8J8GHW9_9BACI|nr:bifunctional diguanylate cyclase/phosphodiesterase [Calidifontibacillus erzurumensis]NSL52698.1 EAL domain-containing protein [Calidifontibacillus erzurumensis]
MNNGNHSFKMKNELLAEVYNHMVYGMCVTNSKNRILYVNQAYTKLTGYSEEEVKGKDPKILSSGLHDKAFYREMWRSIRQKGMWKGEIWNKRKSGELFLEEISIYVIKDQDGRIKNYVSVFLDITERKKLEEQLKFLAYYDNLTKLPNRTYFYQILNETMKKTTDTKSMCAVIFLDLDRFKDINDTLGHGMGDQLLKMAAKRLTKVIGSHGTVARYGGDEFAIILHDVPSKFTCMHVANKIIKSFSNPFALHEFEFFVTPSIGISLFPHDGNDAESLVKNADSAMYHAKQEGMNNYKFYKKKFMKKSVDRLILANDLRRAIQKNEFHLCYQPQFSCKTGELIGMEALIRWHHPKNGIISPNLFIPIAEETRMIIHIDQWVLKQVCKQIKDWIDIGFHPPKISVNLAMPLFQHKNLTSIIESILSETGIDPSYLVIELTERIVMDNPDVALENIKRLKAIGLKISMDDFGVHYSSLNYLKLLSPDYLKIDRTFIKNVLMDQDDQAIVKAVIQLAHHMGLTVIAEGVETEEQYQFLKDYECDGVQGFYFDHPLPSKEAVKYIL